MNIILIAAIAKNEVIGKATGEMPWHVTEEFKHFKETTTGYPVLMGRKTFQTLGKPLKNRTNIIISTNDISIQGNPEVFVYKDILSALEFCERQGYEKVFIIGGGTIYAQTISIADEMILSYMNFEAEGEVKFPEFNRREWDVWKVDERELFTIFYYRKKSL
ncbi:MAG: dihydrofolate reductase [Ignavibacteriaceae bacterium]|nr:dihydrofolate reductase [Ignavibacteriaceae bacterium]